MRRTLYKCAIMSVRSRTETENLSCHVETWDKETLCPEIVHQRFGGYNSASNAELGSTTHKHRWRVYLTLEICWRHCHIGWITAGFAADIWIVDLVDSSVRIGLLNLNKTKAMFNEYVTRNCWWRCSWICLLKTTLTWRLTVQFSCVESCCHLFHRH